jgi:putative phosphoesterase
MIIRVLLTADIHANSPALMAVLKDAGKVDLILHAGDIVDYNPFPNVVISIVQEIGIRSVMGNHDRDSAMNQPYGYNALAQMSCRWTYHKLTVKERGFLLSLPRKLVLEVSGLNIFVCHGSPWSLLDEYVYPDEVDQTFESFLKETSTDLIVLGHTHIPFIKRFDGSKYVLNPGSVGQPRDRNPKASYMILDISEKKEVQLSHQRVRYDIDKVYNSIVSSELPRQLGERLYHGL